MAEAFTSSIGLTIVEARERLARLGVSGPTLFRPNLMKRVFYRKKPAA